MNSENKDRADKKIQYGVMVYNKYCGKSVNIGDYIQSLAASIFSDSIDVFLEREELNLYRSSSMTLVILNGWFMFCPHNFPPSDDIIPLVLSIHITPNFADRILSLEGINWLKKHEPIGCRDTWTESLLCRYGIKSYFSGCLTLTLGSKYKSNTRDGNIYFVDPCILYKKNILYLLIKICKALPLLVTAYQYILEIYGNLSQNQRYLPIKRFVYALLFYDTYHSLFSDEVLSVCEIISHIWRLDHFPGDNEKLTYAETLIKKYAKASLVVTSRIHCALPCLGLETPVIFVINNSINDPRHSGLKNFFRTVSITCKGLRIEDEVLKKINGKITKETKIENKQEHILFKDRLINDCKRFIAKNMAVFN